MVKYRKFKKTDIIPACNLIVATFKKFNYRGESKSAAEKFISRLDAKKNSEKELLDRFASTPIAYVACEGKKIIGLMRGRKERLVNLFVAGSRHKLGIGKNLLNIFEKEARRTGGKMVKIRASLYAVPFYQKFGYKKTTGQRRYHGLKIQPMKKIISRSSH